ncbi:hypothetical protein PO909_004132 [Leuciscus waleckii]
MPLFALLETMKFFPTMALTTVAFPQGDHLAACFFKDPWLGEYMRWNQNRDALPGFAIAWGLCKFVLFLDGPHQASKIVLLRRKIFLVMESLICTLSRQV